MTDSVTDPDTLYLASTSPRRRQLLAEAGFAFELFAISVDEEALTEAYQGPLNRLGEHLARKKALATHAALQAAGKCGRALAADTTVLLDQTHLAKPADLDEGRAMLQALRGREHIVATGVALAGPEPGRIASATAITRVLMRDYTDDEIEAYVLTGDSLDKAGGYTILSSSFRPVERIYGCYPSVAGLPLCLVDMLLGYTRAPLGEICPWSDRCRPPLPVPADIHPGETDAFGDEA
jgi:nucleoside triphosphate pyrophosphatase